MAPLYLDIMFDHKYVNKIFQISQVRESFSKIRFYIFKFFHKLNISNDVNNVSRFEYSKSHFDSYESIRHRVDFLVSMLTNNVKINRDINMLVIGPRYESEIFGYIGAGINRIIAIDTFSYSKLIKVGNMHSLEFESNTFDVLLCGWTLAYSSDVNLAVEEMSRVLKLGGKLIVSFDTNLDLIPISIEQIKLTNMNEIPFIDLLDNFKLHSYTIGKTSWSDTIVASFCLEKVK